MESTQLEQVSPDEHQRLVREREIEQRRASEDLRMLSRGAEYVREGDRHQLLVNEEQVADAQDEMAAAGIRR